MNESDKLSVLDKPKFYIFENFYLGNLTSGTDTYNTGCLMPKYEVTLYNYPD